MRPTGGRYADGQTSKPVPVNVTLDTARQVLSFSAPALPGGRLDWPLEELRSTQEGASAGRLELARLAAESEGDSGLIGLARLTVRDAALIADLRRACPALGKRDVARGTGLKVLKYAAASVTALLVMLFLILPRLSDTLATLIPVEREVAFGKTVVAQMERILGGSRLGALTCSTPEGDAALAAMTARLTGSTPVAYDLNVVVMNHPMVNAFAAPGGQIVLLRGLLDKAPGPDAVAGVLAHEIAHVKARDSTRLALRSAGSAGLLSLVLGDFAGGTLTLVLAEQMLQSGYTRAAEAAADDYALSMLGASDVDASGFAQFFLSLKDASGRSFDLPEVLSSHPILEERAARATAFAEGQSRTRPALSEDDWAALRAICG
ncbi:MAG: M48 family metallopeptidase [Pseudomonadota bacterium]